MTTVNLFTRPGVQGRRASPPTIPTCGAMALAKAIDAIDLGAEFGATIYVLWGGREGIEADAAKPVRDALDRYAEAIDSLLRLRPRPGLRHALRHRAQAQRTARRHLSADRRPRAGLHQRLDSPEMVGVNPEFAHETMAGLSLRPRRRPGAVGRQAVPHRPQRPAHRALRPGLPLRRGGHQGGVLPVHLLGDLGLRRHPPLRRPPLPNRGRRRRLGLRPRLHPHISHSAREGRAIRGRRRDQGGPRGRARARPRHANDGRRRVGRGAAHVREVAR